MDLAVKDVRRHAGKFLATIVGVGLLMAIVLVMNGMYRGNVADGLWLIDHTATDLRVVERDRGGPFNEQSRLPEAAWKSVAATPGVERASPFNGPEPSLEARCPRETGRIPREAVRGKTSSRGPCGRRLTPPGQSVQWCQTVPGSSSWRTTRRFAT